MGRATDSSIGWQGRSEADVAALARGFEIIAAGRPARPTCLSSGEPEMSADVAALARGFEIIAAGRMGRPTHPYFDDHAPPAPLTVVEADGSTHGHAFG